MKKIRHEEESRDSLYPDICDNLETIHQLWVNGNKGIRFVIPILCAAKLEAFINVVGKLKMQSWDSLERRLGFKEKLLVISEVTGVPVDIGDDSVKSALRIFDIRNSLVHPKMRYQKIDEMITQEEYEKRSESYLGVDHHLRTELNSESVENLISNANEFVATWGPKFLDHPEYWLSGGSTGGFTYEPTHG